MYSVIEFANITLFFVTEVQFFIFHKVVYVDLRQVFSG